MMWKIVDYFIVCKSLMIFSLFLSYTIIFCLYVKPSFFQKINFF